MAPTVQVGTILIDERPLRGSAAIATRTQPVNPCERVVYLLALLYFSCLENRHLWSILTRC